MNSVFKKSLILAKFNGVNRKTEKSHNNLKNLPNTYIDIKQVR